MLVFLKLGGSLITDKSRPETPRIDVIERLANEINHGLNARPELKLVIGHGSGSYGHIAAKQFSTHLGVRSPEDWRGFAKVGLSAARLNNIVAESLDHAGVPIFRIQPSASAVCEGGKIREMALGPLHHALSNGLVPLVYGDISVDTLRGGAIMSTEDIFAYLSKQLLPQRMLLIGDYDGVLDASNNIIDQITPANFDQVSSSLRGSAHTDVTGGMASKVATMLDLCKSVPGLSVNIFAGDAPQSLEQALLDEEQPLGTHIFVPDADR